MNIKNKLMRQKRRSTRTRSLLRVSKKRPRLTVFRSNNYIYAQIIDENGKVLVQTTDKSINVDSLVGKTKIQKAMIVGEEIAKKAKAKKINSIVFDRGGYKYHGRIKALADSARKGGLKF